MRLAFLVRSLTCGGAQRQLVLLARELQARGHAVTVLVFYPGGYFEPELRAAGVAVQALGKRGRWDLAGFLPRLLGLLRQLKPDVLYSFLGTPNVTAALLKAGLPQTRVVFGVRGSESRLLEREQVGAAIDWAEARLSRAADLVIANSEAGRRNLLAAGWRARRVTVIENGIDTTSFRPDLAAGRRWRERLGVRDDELLIGMAARIDARKDHDTFLRAAALALRERPDMRFLCVGDGTREFGQAAAARGVAPELVQRTIFAGRVEEMMAIYNALDLATLSSESEGFPNVVGEAMACGVPCVVTDAGDSARIVGETGVVVPPRRPEALAAGWLTALGWRRETKGQAARKRVTELFGVARLAEQTEAALLAL